MKTVVITVGVSGSGKSTWIKDFVANTRPTSQSVASSDHFCEQEGTYSFDATKLSAAHDSSKAAFDKAILEGTEVIFVDNTNTRKWERGYYVTEAKKHKYKVYLKVFKVDPVVAAARNTHGVPLDAVIKMNDRIDVPEGFYEI